MGSKPQTVERPMTKRDWTALYLVMRLQEQIVLHGADALDDFLAIRPLFDPEEPTDG